MTPLPTTFKNVDLPTRNPFCPLQAPPRDRRRYQSRYLSAPKTPRGRELLQRVVSLVFRLADKLNIGSRTRTRSSRIPISKDEAQKEDPNRYACPVPLLPTLPSPYPHSSRAFSSSSPQPTTPSIQPSTPLAVPIPATHQPINANSVILLVSSSSIALACLLISPALYTIGLTAFLGLTPAAVAALLLLEP